MLGTIATRPPARNSYDGDPVERGRAWLDSLFAGDFSFPAISRVPLPTGERSAAEHDAVSRAAGCRDLFVIHADPHAGERAIADLARAAADRVLILSPNPAAADRITERLLKTGVAVLRALADDENPTRPSPAVSKVTSAAIGRARVEQARKEAAAAVAAAEQRIAAFRVVDKAIARLGEASALRAQLEATIAQQTARRAQVEDEVRKEIGSPFATALAKLKTDHDDSTAQLGAELQALVARHKEAETNLSHARHQHAEAARKPGLFARIFSGKAKPESPEATELDRRVHALEAEVAALAAQESATRSKLEAATRGFEAEREKLIAGEIASRRRQLDEQLAAAEGELARTQTELAALNKVIGDAVPGEDHAAADRQLVAARQRLAEVNASALEIVARAALEMRVVVGTPKSLEGDPAFNTPDDPPFGLLILDRAEELPETEFPRLSRLAERWVLVGEATPHDEPRAHNGRGSARSGRSVEVPFVARLAKHLDRDTWAVEGDRLVCRLMPLTPDQRRKAAREPLADRPEIELRFTAPDGEPLLAEIAFPAGMGVPAAKSFLFHTLGEVLLRPCGELEWAHAADSITAAWPTVEGAGAWIDLEPGVREKIVGVGLHAFTAAVRFDAATGWDEEKARSWLSNFLPAPVTGRFAALPRSSNTRHGG